MQALLVNPPKQNFYRRLGIGYPPLGLGYLAAVARQRGSVVQIADLDNDPAALRGVALGRFGLVGISADTIGYPAAFEVAAEARREGARVVLGGYHVTFRDRAALGTGAVDFVIRGEGEGPLLALMEVLEDGRSLLDVPSLSYLRDGRFVQTPPRRSRSAISTRSRSPHGTSSPSGGTGSDSTADGRCRSTQAGDVPSGAPSASPPGSTVRGGARGARPPWPTRWST